MNKSDLVTAVAERAGLSKKDSERALSAAFESITSALEAGEKVQIVGFGVFDVKDRAARVGRNPRTNQEIQIAASRSPVFKPGKALKERIDKSRTK